MRRWIGHYRCQACRHEWKEPAGPVECPRCGHIWVDWLNFPGHGADYRPPTNKEPSKIAGDCQTN